MDSARLTNRLSMHDELDEHLKQVVTNDETKDGLAPGTGRKSLIDKTRVDEDDKNYIENNDFY